MANGTGTRMQARAFTEERRWQISEPPPDSPPKAEEGATAQSLSRAYGSQPQRARSFDAFDVNWNEVQLLPQLSNMSCWAAAAAMVVGWRDQMSIDPGEIARGAGQWAAYQNGFNPRDLPSLASAWGLIMEPLQSYTIEGFRQMLERNGPLWVGAAAPTPHAIIVTGVRGDGTPDGTYVRIGDPWGRAADGMPGNPAPYNPTPGSGSQYQLTFRQFVQEYEAAPTDYSDVSIQILHSGGTGGRVAGASSGHSLARGYAQPQAGPGVGLELVKLGFELLPALSTGDNKWILQRSTGTAFPQSKPALEGAGRYQRKVLRVQGPRYNGPMSTNYLDIDLEFKYNGNSIKDVVPILAGMDDVLGCGINLEGQVIEQTSYQLPNGIELPSNPNIAVVCYVLMYHYDYTGYDEILRTTVWMLGDGSQWVVHDWPDAYHID